MKINNRHINPMLMTDFYKTIHHLAYVPKMEKLVSYWTTRMTRKEEIDKVVMFGLQALIKEHLINDFNDNLFNVDWDTINEEYIEVISNTMSVQASDTTELKRLYDLGYLPIEIKAIEEGERVNIKTPMFEISNTVDGFGWLVNYLETYISVNIWHPMTSASTAYSFREVVNEYFDKTVGEYGVMQVLPKKEGGYLHHPVDGQVKLNSAKNTACGDFSMRGMTSFESAMASSAGHLTSFTGTATIPAILWLEGYYNCDCTKETVGKGVPSTEHSVMSSYGREGEFECYRHLIEDVFKTGPLSIVSDTYDYWNVLTNYLPLLKDSIMNRDGKVIIRGDSGNPVDIICGTAQVVNLDNEEYIKSLEECQEWMADYIWKEVHNSTTHGECGDDEQSAYFKYQGKIYKIVISLFWNRCDKQYYYMDEAEVARCEEIELSAEQKGTVEILWEIFGGYINEKGYKVLDPHIGTIYGDSITLELAKEIYRRLESKGFAVNNATLGIGSYTYQYVTRDTLGFALKATHSVVDSQERQIYKDPLTDKSKGNNFKKSQRGMCYVYRDGEDIRYTDEHTIEELKQDKYRDNMLKTVFKDSRLIKEFSIAEIRNKLHGNDF